MFYYMFVNYLKFDERIKKSRNLTRSPRKTYDNAFGYGVESNNDLPSHRRQPMITSPTNDQETNVRTI